MNGQPLLVFVQKPGPRHAYIFRQVLGGLLGLHHRLEHNAGTYAAYTGPRLNYSAQPLPGLQVKPFSEQNMPDHHCRPEDLFRTDDLFAKSFYLLTRAEEYGPHQPDRHGRFRAEDSILFRLGLHRQAVVNRWAQDLGKKLKEAFPEIILKKHTFSALATVDVDAAWCYSHKGLHRQVWGMLADLMRLRARRCVQRASVWLGAKDPFDCYPEILEMHREAEIPLQFFWLLGKHGRFDKNLHWKNREQQALIQQLAANADIGIHPSYYSPGNTSLITTETARLNTILAKLPRRQVGSSRQHYLRIHWPATYRSLIRLGIQLDHSLGWPSQVGFRAGICTPYVWYDLQAEEETALQLMPFAAMDVTLKSYLNLSPAEALATCKALVDEVAAVGGTFVSLWHNESLSGHGQWQHWPAMYRQLLTYISSLTHQSPIHA